MVQLDKALFVHIPKTGGTWVRELLLENNGVKFSYPHDLPQHHTKKIKKLKLEPFCFVRHPLELLYSLWKHWSGDENCRLNNLNPELYWQWDKKEYGFLLAECIVEGDINATVSNFVTKYPGFFSAILDKYSKRCKYIGRYENIKEDLMDIVFKANGEVQEHLLIDIYANKKVNESKGNEGSLSKELALRFISKEPACFLYNYTYLPEFVSQ